MLNDTAGEPERDLTIHDAPDLPVVSITAVEDIRPEGASTPAVLRVSRTGPTDESLQVLFGFGGAATEGADFTPRRRGRLPSPPVSRTPSSP